MTNIDNMNNELAALAAMSEAEACEVYSSFGSNKVMNKSSGLVESLKALMLSWSDLKIEISESPFTDIIS